MTQQEKIRLIAEYDGWVMNYAVFKKYNSEHFEKAGSGFVKITKLQYATSYDW